MKKIYNYILPVLFTVFAASCDGDDEEVIRMQNQDPVVTVTSVSDAVGYVGNEFTIYGTNFGIIAMMWRYLSAIRNCNSSLVKMKN